MCFHFPFHNIPIIINLIFEVAEPTTHHYTFGREWYNEANYCQAS